MSDPKGSRVRIAVVAGVVMLGFASAADAGELRVRASQDTQVDATAPTRAHGAARELRVSTRPLRRAFMRFDLRSLTAAPAAATLRLYVASRSGGRVSVNPIAAGQRWSERKTTFANAPAVRGVSKRSTRAKNRRWVTVDVAGLIEPGQFSDLAVTGAPAAVIASSESAHRPELDIVPASPAPVAAPFTPAPPPFMAPTPPAAGAQPPKVALTGVDGTDEGTTRRFGYAVTDPDSAPAVTESCGAKAVRTGPSSAGSFECNFPDGPAKSTVSVRADGGGGVGSDQIVVMVANVAPTATLSSTGPIDEGGTATIAFADEADSSAADTAAGFRYAFHCDGSPFDPAPSYDDASAQRSTTCRFDERGVKRVRALILDKDGGLREYTTDVTVGNAAPVVSAGPDQSADEGGATTFQLGSFADAGGGPWTVDVDWGDGRPHSTGSRASAGSLGSAPHTYADGPATRTVTVTVADADGAGNSAAFRVMVANVAPTVTAAGDQAASTGTSASIDLGLFTDPNPGDHPWSVEVDWGDGSGTTFEAASTGALGTRDHTYATDGSHPVSVSVTDKDGGTGTGAAFTVHTTTTPARLTVVLAATPSSPQDFAFTIAGDPDEPTRDVVLDPEHASRRTFDITGSGFGPTTITQAAVPFWALDGIACTGDPDWVPATADGRVDLDIDPGENVVCTFSNRRVASTVGGVFPESSSDIGPIEDRNGNLYTVTELRALDPRPCLRKSIDGGRTWTEVDGDNRPSWDDLESVSLVTDRQKPYLVHMLMQRSGTNRVSYDSFYMSDVPAGERGDRWVTKDELVTIPGSNPSDPPNDSTPLDEWVSLVQRSNGDLIAFYAAEKSSPGPAGLEQVGYKVFSGGSWGPEQLLVPSPTASATQAVAVMGDGDVTHVFYKNQSTQRIWYRTLDAGGTLGAPKELTDFGANGSRHIIATPVAHVHYVRPSDGRTVERFVVGWKRSTGGTLNGVVIDDGEIGPETQISDVPILHDPASTQSFQTVAGFAADDLTGNVYAVYSDGANHDLYYDVLRPGGTWGTDVEALDGYEVMEIQPIMFRQRPAVGGARVLGVLFDDNVGFETQGLDNVPRYTEVPIG